MDPAKSNAKEESQNPQIRKLPEEVPALSQIIRQTAIERFIYISGQKSVKVEEVEIWDDFSYGIRLAIIFIAGKDLKLIFKSHFNDKSAQTSFLKEKTQEQVFDVFKEYCNLCAGGIKKILTEKDILCGISLPTITSGYDEIIFSDALRNARLVDYFSIVLSNYRFVVSVSVDIYDPPLLEKLNSIAPGNAEEDDIEFF